MKPWHIFKSHDKKISTDSVSIDQELYEAIQLDAYKEGMSDASEIANSRHGMGSLTIATAILTARDNKTTI